MQESCTANGVTICHYFKKCDGAPRGGKNEFARKINHRSQTYMIMGNVVKEVPSHPAEQRPINSRESATKKSPFFVAIMRNSGIRVMKICEHHNPFSARQRSGLTEPMHLSRGLLTMISKLS